MAVTVESRCRWLSRNWPAGLPFPGAVLWRRRGEGGGCICGLLWRQVSAWPKPLLMLLASSSLSISVAHSIPVKIVLLNREGLSLLLGSTPAYLPGGREHASLPWKCRGDIKHSSCTLYTFMTSCRKGLSGKVDKARRHGYTIAKVGGIVLVALAVYVLARSAGTGGRKGASIL